MKTVSQYEELAPLISTQFRRGVRTNAFFSRQELEGLIAREELSVQETGAGLLLLVERPWFDRLHFYLNDLSAPLGAALPDPTVTEVAFRPQDTGLREAVDYLRGQGFAPLLSRVRLSRPAGEAERPCPPQYAGEEEERDTLALLWDSFPRLTGCLPSRKEWSEEVAAGRCLVERDRTGVAGLLHFSLDRRGGEIRHLAVRPDARGCGLSTRLISAYLSAAGGAATSVWTGADNLPALRAYAKLGFQPDGWESIVLCNQEKRGI